MTKRPRRSTNGTERPPPIQLLLGCIDAALDIARTAARNGKSLDGANFYANKMANVRADATNAFARLSTGSVGDTAALAELMQKVFSIDASPKDRAQAARDIQFALRTTWAKVTPDQSTFEDSGIFPLVTLNQTKRGYLVAVGRQMNGCYSAGWYDACAVMMRRLLESSIIEAFEGKKIDGKIKDGNGDFFQLTALIKVALAETAWNLPRTVKKQIETLRDLGHASAHNRYYLAKQQYIDEVKGVYRETVEAFLHIAGLL
jgi:hypothetical protein